MNYTTNESNNVIVGFGWFGNTGESNTINIGNSQHDVGMNTHIHGIFGATYALGGVIVSVDNSGKLGTAPSAERFKKEIEEMGNYSEKIYDLKPVTFVYKHDPTETRVSGLVAEDVKKVYPELVVYDKDGEILSVANQYLQFLMLNEMKKLEIRLSALEKL